MKKTVFILLILSFLLFSDSYFPKVVLAGQYEDTVGESIWDWATTLGKSPQEKKTIKARRRVQRTRKRAEKKARAQSAQLEKENRRREKEAEKLRNARVKAQQRKLEKRRLQEEF